MIRLPASDQKHRIGSLAGQPRRPRRLRDRLRRTRPTTAISTRSAQRYDMVGFDPRGVARSAPVECLTDQQMDAVHSRSTRPRRRRPRSTTSVAPAKAFAARCKARSGKLLGHVSTVDSARDMDVLRARCSATRSSTTSASPTAPSSAPPTPGCSRPSVGAAGARRRDRPRRSTSQQINLAQAGGFEVASRAFAADCVKRAGCPLGRRSPRRQRGSRRSSSASTRTAADQAARVAR